MGVAQRVSEDAARRSLARMDESSGVAWLERHLARTTQPLLATPWILDLDATVKCLYGKQEGAVVGYNPKKPGRPAHSYHSVDGEHAAGIGGGGDGGQRDRAHAQHARDMGLAGFVAQGAASRLAAR